MFRFFSRLFKSHELVKIDTSRQVIFASGGPIMEAVATEGNKVLCEWNHDGVRERHLFPVTSLRRLVFFSTADVPFATDDPFNVRDKGDLP